MPLAELQQDFANYLLDRPSRIQDKVAGGPHAATDRLLGIYHNAYGARLVGILRDEFPSLRRLAGDDAFDRIARAYLAAHPSRYSSVRWIGIGFADFLAETDPWRADTVLSDMARIEWAQSMAFDAADEPLATRDALASVPPTGWPGLILVPHASVQTIDVSPDVFAVWNRVSRDEDAGGRPTDLAPPAPHLVWRTGLDVKLRAFETDEAFAWEAAVAGRQFADICECLAEHTGPDQAAFRAATLLDRWIVAGMIGRIEFVPDMSS
jgi:hypothetical protein